MSRTQKNQAPPSKPSGNWKDRITAEDYQELK